MGATPTTTNLEARKQKKREKKMKLLNLYVETGAAQETKELLREDPTLYYEKYFNPQGIEVPLIHQSIFKGNVGVTKILLDHDPEAANFRRVPQVPQDYAPYGEYPLQTAILGGCVNMVGLLLKAKAEVNCEGSQFKSAPLLLAMRDKRGDIIKLLLESEADISIKCKFDVSSIELDCIQVFATCCIPSNFEWVSDVVEILFKRGLDVNSIVNSQNQNLLHLAVHANNDKLVKLLLNHKVDVNHHDSSNLTPLQYWIRNPRETPLLEYLLDSKADIQFKDPCGNNLLHHIAMQGSFSHPQAIEMLLSRGFDLNEENYQGQTALELAFTNHSKVAVKCLLSSPGVDIYHMSSGTPPLIQSILNGWLPECTELISRGADPNIRDVRGNQHPALFYTLSSNSVAFAELFLNSGADPNLTDSGGDTALHWIANNGNITCFDILMKHGADPALRNSRNQLPIDVALIQNQRHVVSELLKATPDIDIETLGVWRGSPQVIHCVKNFWTDILNLLISRGVDLNVPDDINTRPSALHYAVFYARADLVDILLNGGADVNIQDNAGDTPLHWAVTRVNGMLVEKLLVANADTGLVNKDGKSVKDISTNIYITGLFAKYEKKVD